MTDQPITHVIEFQKAEVSPEEMVRRQRVEAERLAGLSPGEWVLWIDASAARLGVPRAPLEAMVKALVAQREKDRRERKADDERHRREQTKRKEREFKLVAELPERERDARLDGLAKRLAEDPAAVRGEFASPPARRPLRPSSPGPTRSRPQRCWRSWSRTSSASLCSGMTPTPSPSRCGSCSRGFMMSRCIPRTWP